MGYMYIMCVSSKLHPIFNVATLKNWVELRREAMYPSKLPGLVGQPLHDRQERGTGLSLTSSMEL